VDRFATSVAHPARRYNCWLGGTDHFAADRESGDLIVRAFPTARVAARENRAFLRRSVRFLAESGVRQFLDIGTAALPPGSYLVASNLTLDHAPPEQVAKHEELLAAGRTDARARNRDEFGRFFNGLEIVPPGIVAVSEWQPTANPRPSAAEVSIYGAVGRMP
jgi:S-adenosyl methyltransferase